MHISWSGHYAVKLSNPKHSIVINPYSSDIGLPPFRAKADIVLLSNPQDQTMSCTKCVQGENHIVIDEPGEYSINDLTIYGTGWHDNSSQYEQIFYLLYFDDITVLYLGSINRSLTQEELQKIEQSNIDVLFVPVGGHTSINTDQAASLVGTLEPNIVIPVNYSLPKLKDKDKVAKIDSFAREMGISPRSKEKKILVTANKIDRENIKTTILSP